MHLCVACFHIVEFFHLIRNGYDVILADIENIILNYSE